MGTEKCVEEKLADLVGLYGPPTPVLPSNFSMTCTGTGTGFIYYMTFVNTVTGRESLPLLLGSGTGSCTMSNLPIPFDLDYDKKIYTRETAYPCPKLLTTLSGNTISYVSPGTGGSTDMTDNFPIVNMDTEIASITRVTTPTALSTTFLPPGNVKQITPSTFNIFLNTTQSAVTAPQTVPTPSLLAEVGTLNIGTYKYKVSFRLPDDCIGESLLGPESTTVTTDPGHSKISLSGIETSTSNSVIGRYVYRTQADGSVFYYVGTVNDNVTTTFIDNVPDSALTLTNKQLFGTYKYKVAYVTKSDRMTTCNITAKSITTSDPTLNRVYTTFGNITSLQAVTRIMFYRTKRDQGSPFYYVGTTTNNDTSYSDPLGPITDESRVEPTVNTTGLFRYLFTKSGTLFSSLCYKRTYPDVALTATALGVSDGTLSAGTYSYKFTYTLASVSGAESERGLVSNSVTTITGDKTVLTGFPTTTDPNITSINIYRTKVNEYVMYLLTSVSPSTTTYTDNTPDASLSQLYLQLDSLTVDTSSFTSGTKVQFNSFTYQDVTAVRTPCDETDYYSAIGNSTSTPYVFLDNTTLTSGLYYRYCSSCVETAVRSMYTKIADAITYNQTVTPTIAGANFGLSTLPDSVLDFFVSSPAFTSVTLSAGTGLKRLSPPNTTTCQVLNVFDEYPPAPIVQTEGPSSLTQDFDYQYMVSTNGTYDSRPTASVRLTDTSTQSMSVRVYRPYGHVQNSENTLYLFRNKPTAPGDFFLVTSFTSTTFDTSSFVETTDNTGDSSLGFKLTRISNPTGSYNTRTAFTTKYGHTNGSTTCGTSLSDPLTGISVELDSSITFPRQITGTVLEVSGANGAFQNYSVTRIPGVPSQSVYTTPGTVTGNLFVDGQYRYAISYRFSSVSYGPESCLNVPSSLITGVTSVNVTVPPIDNFTLLSTSATVISCCVYRTTRAHPDKFFLLRKITLSPTVPDLVAGLSFTDTLADDQIENNVQNYTKMIAFFGRTNATGSGSSTYDTNTTGRYTYGIRSVLSDNTTETGFCATNTVNLTSDEMQASVRLLMNSCAHPKVNGFNIYRSEVDGDDLKSVTFFSRKKDYTMEFSRKSASQYANNIFQKDASGDCFYTTALNNPLQPTSVQYAVTYLDNTGKASAATYYTPLSYEDKPTVPITVFMTVSPINNTKITAKRVYENGRLVSSVSPETLEFSVLPTGVSGTDLTTDTQYLSTDDTYVDITPDSSLYSVLSCNLCVDNVIDNIIEFLQTASADLRFNQYDEVAKWYYKPDCPLSGGDNTNVYQCPGANVPSATSFIRDWFVCHPYRETLTPLPYPPYTPVRNRLPGTLATITQLNTSGPITVSRTCYSAQFSGSTPIAPVGSGDTKLVCSCRQTWGGDFSLNPGYKTNDFNNFFRCNGSGSGLFDVYVWSYAFSIVCNSGYTPSSVVAVPSVWWWPTINLTGGPWHWYDPADPAFFIDLSHDSDNGACGPPPGGGCP